jgi:hypothetical protein
MCEFSNHQSAEVPLRGTKEDEGRKGRRDGLLRKEVNTYVKEKIRTHSLL